MFENFTFDAPRSPSLGSENATSTRETSRSVSPCSPTGPFPPPRFTVTDLAASFANSRLRADSQICYDSCEAYANTDDDAGWEVPGDDFPQASRTRTRTLLQRSHSPSRRMARQVSTRLLCSTTHAKDIAALVSRMVDSQEQCDVFPSGSSKNTIEVDDEGYDSDEDTESRRSSLAVSKSRLNYRRTSDMKSTGTRVCKAVRCHKQFSKERRIRSSGSES